MGISWKTDETGVVFAVNGQITLGEFMAFISYNASLTWPVRSLGRIISDMSKAGVSMERVAYILEAEEEDAAVKCEAKSTDRNENAENIYLVACINGMVLFFCLSFRKFSK